MRLLMNCGTIWITICCMIGCAGGKTNAEPASGLSAPSSAEAAQRIALAKIRELVPAADWVASDVVSAGRGGYEVTVMTRSATTRPTYGSRSYVFVSSIGKTGVLRGR
jgi:hypothetical protein